MRIFLQARYKLPRLLPDCEIEGSQSNVLMVTFHCRKRIGSQNLKVHSSIVKVSLSARIGMKELTRKKLNTSVLISSLYSKPTFFIYLVM